MPGVREVRLITNASLYIFGEKRQIDCVYLVQIQCLFIDLSLDQARLGTIATNTLLSQTKYELRRSVYNDSVY